MTAEPKVEWTVIHRRCNDNSSRNTDHHTSVSAGPTPAPGQLREPNTSAGSLSITSFMKAMRPGKGIDVLGRDGAFPRLLEQLQHGREQ